MRRTAWRIEVAMGLLLDTVNDALRPLPGPAVVLRRSAAGDIELAPDDGGDDAGADPGSLTLYRLQKDGGEQPPLAPPRGPSAIDQGAPAGAAGVDGVVASEMARIAHPLVNRRDGLERGEEITRHGVERESSVDRQSGLLSVSPVPAGSLSSPGSVPASSLLATNVEVVVPVVTTAPAQRMDGSAVGRQVARGAPSEDLSPAHTALAAAGIGQTAASHRGAPAAHAAAIAAAVVAQAMPATAPRQTAATPAVWQGKRAAADALQPGGLRIGRIDVTVLGQAPHANAPAASAAPLADNHFLSRNYLRRT